MARNWKAVQDMNKEVQEWPHLGNLPLMSAIVRNWKPYTNVPGQVAWIISLILFGICEKKKKSLNDSDSLIHPLQQQKWQE